MIEIAYTWISAALMAALLFVCWKKIGIKDVPSYRSTHIEPVPTAAGVCISIVFLSFFFITKLDILSLELPSTAFVAGFVMLTVIGFIDDWKELNYKIRLISHILAVGCVLTQQNLSIPEYLFWFFIGVGLVNACNFLDGLNGLLASQWLLTIGFLLCAFASFTSIFWVLWFSMLVYLFFNFPKAKVFMGDTGSTILGFSYFFIIFNLSFLQLNFPSIFIEHDSFVIFSLLPLGFAWGDIAFTITQRLIRKRSIISSFGDYGFHYHAKFSNSHALVTLSYLIFNYLSASLATFLFFNHHNILLVSSLYMFAQLLHWGIIYFLGSKYSS